VKKLCWLTVVLGTLLWGALAEAKTLYVSKTGADKNDCSSATSACLTIAKGVSSMSGGDTLVIGDGTYTEQIVQVPSGTAAAYTTVMAQDDWGVTIDASGFADNYMDGIRVGNNYIVIRGFHVKMCQAHPTNLGINLPGPNHVKIERCSVSYSGVTGNVAAIAVGPAADYVLIEECYVYGGARYGILVYQSTHTVVRRCVSRMDYWNGDLQGANFTNYNGDMTVWENNIAIDTDGANIGGSGLFAGFFNENKVPDSSWSGTATRETHRGNIVLNVKPKYSAIYDYDISNLHTYSDDIVWASYGGYFGDYIHGDAPMLTGTRFTIGQILGMYDGPDGQGSAGTGLDIGPGTGGTIVSNTVTDSIFWNNPSYGIADHASGDYNSYWGNGANYGGATATPQAGAHDMTSDMTAGLKYLPRIEMGSSLATAGSGGGQVGAEVVSMWGTSGTLWGDPGYDTVTANPLWPFPNEAVIKADMASYTGPGGAGARGFTTGNSKDGTPQTLTKYIWEYLGNQIPPEIYGFHIVSASLPTGTVGEAYSTTLTASGGMPPYTWSVTGSLPPGLMLGAMNGTITGTPTTAGTTTVTLAASDSATPPVSTMVSVQIVVLPAPTQSPDGGNSSGGSASGGGSGDGGAGSLVSADGGDSHDASHSGGCGCRTGAPPTTPVRFAALGVLAGLALLRRRRRL
jgi:MYXO-CTERM domain-containing protein